MGRHVKQGTIMTAIKTLQHHTHKHQRIDVKLEGHWGDVDEPHCLGGKGGCSGRVKGSRGGLDNAISGGFDWWRHGRAEIETDGN